MAIVFTAVPSEQVEAKRKLESEILLAVQRFEQNHNVIVTDIDIVCYPLTTVGNQREMVHQAVKVHARIPD